MSACLSHFKRYINSNLVSDNKLHALPNYDENIFSLNKNVVNDLMSLPVNPVVITCSTKELEFFKGGGAWEGAGNGWVEAQE